MRRAKARASGRHWPPEAARLAAATQVGVDNTDHRCGPEHPEVGRSGIDLAYINSIKIFKANTSGPDPGGSVNVWTYTPGAGPDADPGPGTETLDFSPASAGRGRPAAATTARVRRTRSGLRLDYNYHLKTPLAGLMRIFGGAQPGTIDIVDSTVMALNPTN